MKEQIEKLLLEQKILKQECFELLQELNNLSGNKLSYKEKTILEHSITRTTEEHQLRSVFLIELENLLF